MGRYLAAALPAGLTPLVHLDNRSSYARNKTRRPRGCHPERCRNQSDKYTKGLPEGLPGRGGECLAALRTGIVKNCLHAAYLEYHWNGRAIDAVFEVNQVL